MHFVDTHCHIHFSDYGLNPDEVIVEAKAAGVTRMMIVGCTLEDSQTGVEFVQNREGLWASIGLHPHEARHYQPYLATAGQPTSLSPLTPKDSEYSNIPLPHQKYDSGSLAVPSDPDIPENLLDQFSLLLQKEKVMAIGETGLDYYYNHSPKKAQVEILEFQLELASKNNLPVIFHVRDAFDDFWPIFDKFKGIRGVLHSFTANRAVLDEALQRGLYIGLNGIMTFTKDKEQLEMAKTVPSSKLILETDAPFLTPAPFRGTICKPNHVAVTGEFLAGVRDVSIEKLASQTTENAIKLFNLK